MHPCAAPGCERQISLRAETCLWHRSYKPEQQEQCRECGAKIPPSRFAVCARCKDEIRHGCACGCGHFRRKYDREGRIREFISGHNDSALGDHRPPVNCLQCGILFQPATSRQKLCGQQCSWKWNAANRCGKHQRVPVKCAACGKQITRQRNQVARGYDFACSKKCRYQIVAAKLRERISMPKKLARQRDADKCRVCGFSVLVEVHHIEPRRRNGGGGTDDLSNLITLCPNHHTMADRGLISQSELKAYLEWDGVMKVG